MSTFYGLTAPVKNLLIWDVIKQTHSQYKVLLETFQSKFATKIHAFYSVYNLSQLLSQFEYTRSILNAHKYSSPFSVWHDVSINMLLCQLCDWWVFDLNITWTFWHLLHWTERLHTMLNGLPSFTCTIDMLMQKLIININNENLRNFLANF